MVRSATDRLIRVAVVDSDERVRAALKALLNGSIGYACAGVYRSAEDALKSLPQSKPDVVLAEIDLPRLTGIEWARRVKLIMPALLIVIHSHHQEDDLVLQALAVGVDGYLLKETSPSELLAAVREVCDGGGALSGSIARLLIQAFHRQRHEPEQTNGLSRREKEILRYLARGYLYKEIAGTLSIGYETVHAHVGSIYRKLNVRSRTEAVAHFLETAKVPPKLGKESLRFASVSPYLGILNPLGLAILESFTADTASEVLRWIA